MPSLSFFKKRKSRDRQSSSRTSGRDDSRTDQADENREPINRGPEPAHTRGEPSDHSSGAGAPTASPVGAKNAAKEDEKTKARLARRGSTRELFRGFLGHSSRGSRKDVDTGRSSPSWTSRSAASTPLPEYHPLRSEHEHEHGHEHHYQHQHQHDPEPGTEHKLGHGFEREREPESEPEHASARAAATATTAASKEEPAQPSPRLRENPSQRPRPVSAIAATSNIGSSLPGRWKSQRLKRLQSLAFRPRDKREKESKKTEAPQVTVTPATAVSHPDRSFIPPSVSPSPPPPLMPPSHRSRPRAETDRPRPWLPLPVRTPHSKVLPQIVSPCRRRLPQHFGFACTQGSRSLPSRWCRLSFGGSLFLVSIRPRGKWFIPVIYILLYMNLTTSSRDHLSAGHRFSFPSVPASRSLNRTMPPASTLV